MEFTLINNSVRQLKVCFHVLIARLNWKTNKRCFVELYATRGIYWRHPQQNAFTATCWLLPRIAATTEKAESEEEEGVENESELSEKLEDCDQRKTIRVKPFGGPLLAQT